jgi:hypothetical protein
MRTGFNGKLIEHEGRFVGFCLGADFCAEHEWGIKDLKRKFAINDSEIGLKARQINMAHGLGNKVVLLENKQHLVILCTDWYSQEPLTIDKFLDCHSGKELKWRADKDGFAGAWSEGDFALLVRKSNMLQTEEQKRFEGFARQLFKAFEDNDIAFLFSRSLPVFENPGLCLCVASSLPKEVDESLTAADLDKLALEEAAEKTGIKAKIAAANKEATDARAFADKPFGYFALSPRWRRENEEKPSKHPVMFLLNPFQQDRYEWGIYTVEELEQWLEGKGPVIKNKKKAG